MLVERVYWYFVYYRGYTSHAYYLKYPQISRTFFQKLLQEIEVWLTCRNIWKRCPQLQFSIVSNLKPRVTKLRPFHPRSFFNAKSYWKTVLNKEVPSINTRERSITCQRSRHRRRYRSRRSSVGWCPAFWAGGSPVWSLSFDRHLFHFPLFHVAVALNTSKMEHWRRKGGVIGAHRGPQVNQSMTVTCYPCKIRTLPYLTLPKLVETMFIKLKCDTVIVGKLPYQSW